MKLKMLLESGPGIPADERAKMHAKLTWQNLTPPERTVINMIKDRLLSGKSQIKDDLATNSITMPEILYSIKNERCIRAHDRDIGSTYLENVIGNAIRDLFVGPKINIARRIFGMKPAQIRTQSSLPQPQKPQQSAPTPEPPTPSVAQHRTSNS